MENSISQTFENLNKKWQKADADFAEDLSSLYLFEERILKSAIESAAEHISRVLSSFDEVIREDIKRQDHYNIQRQDTRTITTTAGDVTFNHTYFVNRESGKHIYLLDKLLQLDPHERLSEQAEAKVLEKAIEKSYKKGGEILGEDCAISKTAVMDKVHGIENYHDEKPEKKRQVKVLYIEADEDHIASQKGAKERHPRGMIGKLVYIYEAKEDVCKGRRKLVQKHHIGGLYYGEENKSIWKETWEYIESHYDTEYLESIYVGSDGGNWIKAAETELPSVIMALDKYHLMQYINSAAHQMLDEDAIAKERIWKCLVKGEKKKFGEIMKEMMACANNTGPIEACRDYVLNNWTSVKNRLKLDKYYGCSAEGHVSHIYSDRLSSRPMGWVEKGADRMCMLRCFVENYGREKIIDLVRYKREKKRELKATGTEGIPIAVEAIKNKLKRVHRDYDSYIDKMNVTIPGYYTIKKTLAIREQIGFI